MTTLRARLAALPEIEAFAAAFRDEGDLWAAFNRDRIPRDDLDKAVENTRAARDALLDAVLREVEAHFASEAVIEAAAASLANAPGVRKGMPPVANPLDYFGSKYRAELIEDTKAALAAALGAGG